MCTGSSTATVGTSTPIKKGSTVEEAKVQLDAANAANLELEKKKKNPLAAPTLTDEALVKARTAAYLKLSTGQGRKNSFLSGPGGDLTLPSAKTRLGGY